MIGVKTALLGLTVAATGVAGLGAWRAHAFHGGAHARHHPMLGRFIDFAVEEKLRELDATEAQRQTVREVKERLMREGKVLHDDHTAFREELLGLLSRDDLDPARLRALVKARTDSFARFADDAANAVIELHGAFTPEQRARLLADLREHLASRHH